MAAHDTVYIVYHDAIDDKKVRGLMGICADIIAKMHPRKLYFLFSSNGGSVDAGVTLYNYLRSIPVEVVMHNMGCVDSVATIIFAAGHRRIASKHCTFLFHGVAMPINQGAMLNENQLKEILSRLKKDAGKIEGILKERTKLTAGEILNLFVQGESKDPAFAVEKGIVDEIAEPSIPQDAPVITVNIN